MLWAKNKGAQAQIIQASVFPPWVLIHVLLRVDFFLLVNSDVNDPSEAMSFFLMFFLLWEN